MRETLFHIYLLWNVRNIRLTQNVWDHGYHLIVLIDGRDANCWNDNNIAIYLLSDQHLKYWLRICCFSVLKLGWMHFKLSTGIIAGRILMTTVEIHNHWRVISIDCIMELLLESCHCAYLFDAVPNTRRPRQHGRNFQTMLPKGPVSSKASLIPGMAWRRTDHKPLPEPMTTSSMTQT